MSSRVLALALWLPACALAAWQVADAVPLASWWPGLIWPNPADTAQIVTAFATLPRATTACLAGVALGLAGALLQCVLRNPIASPDTLGISAAAQLGLAAASLYAPDLLNGFGREAVACAAGAIAAAAVLALTWRSGLAAATVVLAGLAVALYAGALGTGLALLHGRALGGLFLWAGGDLAQQGWTAPSRLLLCTALGGAATALLARPLRMLALPDDVARAAGTPVAAIRGAGLVVAVGLAGSVSGLIGTIGFIGLAAPMLVSHGRRPLLWSPVLGGGLLLLVDGLVQRGTADWAEPPPTGAVTALLGAPLLLWLLLRLRHARAGASGPTGSIRVQPWWPIGSGLAALAVTAAGALAFAPTLHGWQWGGVALGLRAPRVAAAALGGGAVGLAGTVLQRVTGNAAASPEVLGLSTGATLGLVLALLLGLDAGAVRPLASVGGAGAVLALVLFFGRGGAEPGRMLIAGIALSAAFGALLALFLATGDPRGEAVLAVVSGSTYGVEAAAVAHAAAAFIVLAALTLPCLRWLELLSLGDTVARALGGQPRRFRAVLLVHVAGLTALATWLTGPLSFVGLMAPHLARLAGVPRAGGQMTAAVLFGALVMVAADWAGRTVLFPAELPAGLVAGVLGAPVLLFVLARRPA